MSVVYKSYQHQSQNFDPSKVETYTLSIYLKEGFLVYSILSDEGKILAVKEYRTQLPLQSDEFLEAVVNHDEFLKKEFKDVRIICGVTEFSLVPESLFNRGAAADFARILVNDDVNSNHVDFEHLIPGDAIAVYTIPKLLKEKFENLFKAPRFQPFCKQAIGMTFALAGETPNVLLLNIFEKQFSISAIKNGRLNFCNSFEYAEPADIVYFVQLVIEVMDLGGAPVEILMAGEFELESKLFNDLRRYIPGVRVPGDALINSFDTQSEKLPAWKYAFMTY